MGLTCTKNNIKIFPIKYLLPLFSALWRTSHFHKVIWYYLAHIGHLKKTINQKYLKYSLKIFFMLEWEHKTICTDFTTVHILMLWYSALLQSGYGLLENFKYKWHMPSLDRNYEKVICPLQFYIFLKLWLA